MTSYGASKQLCGCSSRLLCVSIFFPSSVKCHQNTTTSNSVHHTLISYLWEIWKLPFISVHPVFTTLSNYWKSSWKIHYFLSNSEKFWIKFRCELTDEIKKKKKKWKFVICGCFFKEVNCQRLCEEIGTNVDFSISTESNKTIEHFHFGLLKHPLN